MAEGEGVGKMEQQIHVDSAAAEEDDLPLPVLFDKAYLLASTSSLDQAEIRKGVQLLLRCQEMLRNLGHFSCNETKEEVPIENLKYLLVPFLLGKMTCQLEQEDRIKSSQDHFKCFISTCQSLKLLDTNEKEAGQDEFLEDNGDQEKEERQAWLGIISSALSKASDLLEVLNNEEEMLMAVKEEGHGKVMAKRCLTLLQFGWRKLRESTTYLEHAPAAARLIGAMIDLAAPLPVTPLLLASADAATQVGETIDLAGKLFASGAENVSKIGKAVGIARSLGLVIATPVEAKRAIQSWQKLGKPEGYKVKLADGLSPDQKKAIVDIFRGEGALDLVV